MASDDRERTETLPGPPPYRTLHERSSVQAAKASAYAFSGRGSSGRLLAGTSSVVTPGFCQGLDGQPRLTEPPAKSWRRRGSASWRGGETVSSADGRTSGLVGEDSELDARAELDDAVWRDAEEVGRRTRVARHEAE